MQRVRLILILLAIAAGGAGLWWWWRSQLGGPPTWQGYVDADIVRIGPVEPGQITKLSVVRGQRVAAGALLFVQDETEDGAAANQAQFQLAQAEAQLANLQQGGKPTEIAQAEANLADAQANASRAALDLHRGQALLPARGISVQDFDQLSAQSRSADAKVAAAQAALDQARAPMGRPDEIVAQTQAVAAARAALDGVNWRLAQRRITAPTDGEVVDVLARPGETLAAGAPVIAFLPPENVLVRFFVPETVLAGMHRGDRVTIGCDGCADVTATISFISPQAEYTPPVIYSDQSRSKLVYLIEAHPPRDRATTLNPGQPVTVRKAL